MFKAGQSVIVKNGASTKIVELTGEVNTGSIYGFTGRYFGLVRGALVEASISWIPVNCILGLSTVSAKDAAKPLEFS
jgi:hypothetical protein